MNYSNWLELIEVLKTSSKKEYIERFISEPLNNNLLELLKPKIIKLFYQRFNNSVKNIIDSLDAVLEDEYVLDMELVNFRKSNQITFRLLQNNYLTEEDKETIKKQLYDDIDKVYEILEQQAILFEDDGVALDIIRNNKIKRDDNNEL